MTIFLDWLEYDGQFQESEQDELHFDVTDNRDFTRHYL